MFLAYGVILALIMTLDYIATAKIESGHKRAGLFFSNNTSWLTGMEYIVVYPTVMFFMLLWTKDFLLFDISVRNLFWFILNLAFSTSVYYGVLLVFYKLLQAKLSSRMCVALWIIPFVAGSIGQYLFMTSYYEVVSGNFYSIKITEELCKIMFIIWEAGFAVTITMRIINHNFFCSWLKKDSKSVKAGTIKTLWKEECTKIGLEEDVDLRLTDKLPTALSVGLFPGTRTTYFPQKEYTEEEYRFICQHEIRHIQRRDTKTKFILEFMLSMMWFTPIVWLAVSKAEDEMELACDEIVVKNLDAQKRKQYAELILCSSGKVKGFTTCLSDRAKGLKYRLGEIVNPHRRIDTALIVLGASFVYVLLFSVFSITYI